MTEPQLQQPHHNNDAKGAASPMRSPVAQLNKSRNNLENMQKSMRSIAANKKRVQTAKEEGTVKTTGSGTKDHESSHYRSNGGKQTTDSDSSGNKSKDGGTQPPTKLKKVDIGKVSFANDSDLEDNYEE
eukprot:63899-Ditylum_brightwellii.AAC.1